MADDTRTDWVRWLAAGLLLSAVAFFIAQAATVSLPELEKAEQNWDQIHLLAITGVLPSCGGPTRLRAFDLRHWL